MLQNCNTNSNISVTLDKPKESIGITGLEEIVTDVTVNFRYVQKN